MKEVLIVFPGIHLDVDEGAKHRLNCHINEYSRRGDRVTVLAFCRSGMFRRDRNKYMNSNARWILAPYILPVSKNIVLSKILEFYLGVILMIVTWLKKYDIVQMEIQNIKNSFCRKSLYITDVHGDALYEEIEPKGKSLDDWFAKYLKYLQKNIILNSDHCIVVSENLKQQLEENTSLKIKSHSIISCAVDFERFSKAEKQILPIDLSNRIVLGYSGGLQAWQNFDKMIEVVIELRRNNPAFFFLIYTNNPITPYNKKLKELGEANYYVKSLPSSEVPGYLKLFDAGFLLRENQVLNRVSSPTKICEYLAAGVPMICTQYSGDYKRSIKDTKTGFVVKDVVFDRDEIEELSNWLINVKNNRDSYYKDCQEAASHRTFTKEFEVFYRQIEKLRVS